MLVARITLGVGDVVERSEDRPLQREVLDRGLDDQVGVVGEPVDGRDVAHAVEPGSHPVVGVGLVEAELRGASRQSVADPLAASLDGRLVDVVEDDLAAGLERDLADPRAHRPGADDADDGGQTVARRRRGALAHQTDLIDSNGWRQSAQ